MGKLTTEDSRHVKWENEGQSVQGTFVRMEVTSGKVKGHIVALRDEDGDVFTVSAPTLLAQLIADNMDKLKGREVAIRWVSTDAPTSKKKNGMKRFEVEYDDSNASDDDE